MINRVAETERNYLFEGIARASVAAASAITVISEARKASLLALQSIRSLFSTFSVSQFIRNYGINRPLQESQLCFTTCKSAMDVSQDLVKELIIARSIRPDIMKQNFNRLVHSALLKKAQEKKPESLPDSWLYQFATWVASWLDPEFYVSKRQLALMPPSRNATECLAICQSATTAGISDQNLTLFAFNPSYNYYLAAITAAAAGATIDNILVQAGYEGTSHSVVLRFAVGAFVSSQAAALLGASPTGAISAYIAYSGFCSLYAFSQHLGNMIWNIPTLFQKSVVEKEKTPLIQIEHISAPTKKVYGNNWDFKMPPKRQYSFGLTTAEEICLVYGFTYRPKTTQPQVVACS